MDRIAEKSRRSAENGRREIPAAPKTVQQAPAIRHPNGPRRAKTTAAATSGTTVTANLLDFEGNEITGGEGSNITVNFFWTLSGDTYPAITDDKILPVYKDIDQKWYCPISFIILDTCT